jgi:eukaryotic-like serine/threonine-protein kinase
MANAVADRNLLFGILAVQMDFVSADQLIAGMNGWVLDKGRPLGAHLIDCGALEADTRALIDALVEKHVQQHGGRVEESLAAVAADDTLQDELAAISDADVQTSLAHAASVTPRNDRHATIPFTKRPTSAEGGRFEVLRPHAAGGLGKVSVARDVELNREVALKELHDRHADNLDSRARFVQEAEITGGLEHPGVVPIYALGQYADGRPYYAMQFIRGDSLAQAIERFHREAESTWSSAADVLQLRRLLARFLDVCNAIDYAHSRGVLHRDIKPGNIMLGQYGETLVVDWGLAKAMGVRQDSVTLPADATIPYAQEAELIPQSGSGSAPTQMGSAIGTPAYMSPEQAAGRLDQLGPASDVYSLGATLYVLLTGKAPQEDDDLGIVLQRVQRGEFPSPQAVKPQAPRGLEAICLKAMALRPEDRYPSARKLADDIEAWLADEPITAMRESLRTKAFRWIRTHRTLVTSGAAMVCVALIALGAGNVRLRAANDRERDAKNEAIAAREKAEAAQAEAERQTERNSELVQLARQSLERYESLSQSDQLRRYGMEPLRRELLEVALNFYTTLGRQVGESEKARSDRADALYRLGWTYSAIGNGEQALQSFEQSADEFRKLAEEFPDKQDYDRGVALALVSTAELMNNARNSAASEQALAEARRWIEPLAAKAEDLDDTIRLAYIHSLNGERLRQLGRLEEAADVFADGVALLQRIDVTLLDADKSLDVRYRLGRALNQLAAIESQALWRFKAGREHFDQAEAVFTPLFKERPDVGDVGHSLSQVLRNSGFLYSREHFYEEARAEHLKAFEVMSELERKHPSIPHYRQETAEVLHSLGTLHRAMEEGDMSPEALQRLEEAAAIGAELAEQFPQDVGKRLSLATYQSSLGEAYLLRQRNDDAVRLFTASLENLNLASEQAGDNLDTLLNLGNLQYTIGEQLADVKRFDEALTTLEGAEATLQKLIALAPKFGEAYLSSWNVVIEKSSVLAEKNRLVDSVAELNRMGDVNATLQDLAEAPWMRSGAQAIATLSRSLRWGRLKQIRMGGLNAITGDGQYELAGDQARRFPALTGEASDHYVAAKALAYAATAANADERLGDQAQRAAVVEPLAADAVKQLQLAWEKGYLRRRASAIGGLFGSKVELADLDDVFEFGILSEREDFKALVRRIETEKPPGTK